MEGDNSNTKHFNKNKKRSHSKQEGEGKSAKGPKAYRDKKRD
jgi:hypothetical protein